MGSEKMEGKFIFDENIWSLGLGENYYINSDFIAFNGVNSQLSKEKSVYFSYPLDSREKGSLWNRIVLKLSNEKNISYSIYCYGTDTYDVRTDMGIFNIKNIIYSSEIPFYKKVDFFQNLQCNKYDDINDIYINDIKGRYLFIMIEHTNLNISENKIEYFSVEYNKKQIYEYLPEIYRQKNDFMHSFLGIFQSMIYDFQDEIEKSLYFIDPDDIEGNHLKWLSEWVEAICPLSWNDDKIRRFIKMSFQLYKEKGTKQGIEKLIRFFTDKKFYILENWQIMDIYGDIYYKNEYNKIYGNDIYSFTILVNHEDFENEISIIEFKNMLQRYCPIHTRVFVHKLNNSIVLGDYSYLGINSSISKNKEIVLDNKEKISISQGRLY